MQLGQRCLNGHIRNRHYLLLGEGVTGGVTAYNHLTGHALGEVNHHNAAVAGLEGCSGNSPFCGALPTP
ncbi:hypothetical protein ACNKHO_09165 [Shigella flexneri]